MTGAIRVLHVDDDPEFADLTAKLLKREDERLEVEKTASAEDGLAHLDSEAIDCIVSDHDMPGKNGIEFLEAVREDYPDLPFILFTGKGSEEVASNAVSAGVTDYLQKASGTSQYTVLANRIMNAVERYRSKKQAEATQQRLSLFFEQSPLGVIEWTDEFRFARLNDTAEEILGYSEQELRGESWRRIVPSSNVPPVADVVQDLLDAEGGSHSINENVRKDGERIVCEWHNRVITDETGNVVAIFSQFQDITEENERKAELQQKERRYQAVFNDPNLFAGLTDTNGNVIDINEKTMEGVETPFEEIVGDPVWEAPWVNNDETAQRERQDWINRAANGEYVEFETEHRRPSGELRTVKGVARPVTNDDGTVVSVFISAYDITQQKEHARELEQTNAVLSTLFATLPVGILAEDTERNVLIANDRMFELFEMAGSPDELTGVDCEKLAKQVSQMFVDPEGFVTRINELVENREPVDNEELALVDDRTFERSYRPIELPDGEGHLWIYRDITDMSG